MFAGRTASTTISSPDVLTTIPSGKLLRLIVIAPVAVPPTATLPLWLLSFITTEVGLRLNSDNSGERLTHTGSSADLPCRVTVILNVSLIGRRIAERSPVIVITPVA
jgi:hypothetical protein